MTDLDSLLALQELDIRLDQLGHRRASLAERAVVDEANALQRTVEADIAALEDSDRELGARLGELDVDVAALETRRDKLSASLYDGSVSALKDLEAMQHEIELLNGQIGEHEDRELALMERQEANASERSELAGRHEAARAAVLAATEALDAALAEIDDDVAAITEERLATATSLAPDLVERYEALRTAMGGIAVARFDGRRCHGCHLQLAAVDAAAINSAPPDDAPRVPTAGVSSFGEAPATIRRTVDAATTAQPMILWFASLAMLIVWLVFRSPAIDYRMVALGAVLPVVEVPFGAGLLHTLLASLAVLAVVMAATVGRRLVRRRWLGIPLGMLLHLVLDGVWARPELFWWPVAGGRLWTEKSPEIARGIFSVSMEMVGLIVGIWLLGRWGVLDDTARRRRFLHTGQLARDAVRRPEGEPDRGC